jgi:glycosyltransferase involved in cell wall biosynthesis
MNIKIAFSHEVYPNAGTEKVTEVLAEYLTRKGYKVYVFVEILGRDLLSEVDRRCVEFIETRFGREENTRRIADQINRRGIDIYVVLADWQVDVALLRTLITAKIVFTNHFNAIQEIDDFFIRRRLEARRGLRAGKIGKFVYWYLLREPYEFITRAKRRKMIGRQKSIYNNCDLYTVLCDPYKETILKLLAQGDEDHVVVIGNRIVPREPGPRERRKKVALYIGRLNSYQKRVDRLIDIWAAVEDGYPDWELWVVGRGEERDNLADQVRRLGLRNVRFHDYTTDTSEYYHQAAIVCLTSSNEGWPLVVAEAQQAGAVPIAFDCCAGVRDQIAPDGTDGVIVPPFNKRGYARQLARLMGDDALREEMSHNAVLKAREYSDESRLERWDVEFRKLLNDR